MAGRKVFRVTPARGGGWKLEGGGQARTFSTKEEAVRQGRQSGKAAGLAQLVIHKANGTIETEHTYGQDPRRTKG
jgi:hypothetical protein